MTGNPIHFTRATTGFEHVSPKVLPGQMLFFNKWWEPVVEPCEFLFDTMARGCGSMLSTRGYGFALKHYFIACEKSGVHWKDATFSDLLGYRRTLLQACTARTINHRFAALKGFYASCVYRGSLKSSPFPYRARDERNPFRVREDEVLPRAIPRSHLSRIFSNLASTYRLVSAIALTTGLRSAEFEEFRLAHLPIAPDRYTPFTYFKLRRKGGAKKTVAIPTTLVDEVHKYVDFGERARIRERLYRNGDPVAMHDFAFVTSRGNRVRGNQISKAFTAAVRKANLGAAGYSFHALRHTYALTMAKQLQRANDSNIREGKPGINVLLALRNLMGHKNLSTTELYLTALRIDEAIVSDSVATLYQNLSRDIPLVP